jgi:hypothetical protein
MFADRGAGHVWNSFSLALIGMPLGAAFVALWWPWLVVTGTAQIPFMSDTNVTYGVFCFSPKTGTYDLIKISGEFPHARYVSFMVYGGSRSQPFDVITDDAIKPDPGQINPFLPGADRTAPNRKYTIYAIREGSGIDPSSFANALTIPASESFINLMMRIYRPDEGAGVYGGVPLPTVEAGRMPGPVTAPRYGLGSDLNALLKMFWMVHYQEAAIYDRLHDDTAIEFYHLTRPGGLPNADVPYLDTALGATETGPNAKLAVITFRPPTFANTSNGRDPITGFEDVRYYSFCTSDVATGFNSRCVADNQLALNDDGTITLVVYPPVLETIVKRSGLNRLVRGYSATTSLTYRQLLPAAGFAGSARLVPALPIPMDDTIDLESYKASHYIADYAPHGSYYTRPEFEAWLHHRRDRGPDDGR